MKRILEQIKNYIFPTIIAVCCMHGDKTEPIGIRAFYMKWYFKHFRKDLPVYSHGYCRKCQKAKDAEWEEIKRKDIQRKIESGFYDSDDAMNTVAEKIQTKYRRDTTVDMMLRYLSGGHLQ